MSIPDLSALSHLNNPYALKLQIDLVFDDFKAFKTEIDTLHIATVELLTQIERLLVTALPDPTSNDEMVDFDKTTEELQTKLRSLRQIAFEFALPSVNLRALEKWVLMRGIQRDSRKLFEADQGALDLLRGHQM